MPKQFRQHQFAAIGIIALAGCSWNASYQNNALNAGLPVLENPFFVPSTDREFLWNQVVDTVDDYFSIQREERVRLVQGVLVEGRLETVPTIGSTVLEPWRGDSTRGFERLHATLQSVRRRATVRVAPTDGGYLIEVVVIKELEDVQRPEHSTVGGMARRHDGSLVRAEDRVGDLPATLSWIPLGRDISLEQKILSEIRGRVTDLRVDYFQSRTSG